MITLLSVVLYFVVLFVIGIYFSKKQKTTEDFFLADRSLPGWVVGISLIGTIISSTTFIGHPGAVFTDQMWNVPFFLSLPLVMLFVSRYIVPFYRHTVKMSVYEYLEKRFGYFARVYGSFAFIMSRILDVATTFYFLAIAVAYLSDWNLTAVIFWVGVVTMIYTLIGGIEAATWTNVLQTVMLLGGGLLCIGITLFKPEAGPAAVLAAAWEGGKFGLGESQFSFSERNMWFLFILGIVWGFQRFAVEQHMTQRYLLAKTDREAVRGVYMGAVAALPVWLMFMFLGACLYGFYQVGPYRLPPEVVATKDSILPEFIKTQVPVYLVGSIIASLMAAAMSSLASDLISLATVVIDDYYAKFRPASTDRNRLWVGRGVIVVFGILSIILAQRWVGIGSFMELFVSLFSIATAGVLGLFALGYLTRRANARGVLCGVGACILYEAWGTLTNVLPTFREPLLDLGRYNFTWHADLIGLFSHFVLFGVGYLASLFFGGGTERAAGLTLWDSAERRQIK